MGSTSGPGSGRLRRELFAAGLPLALVASGCMVGPDYAPPSVSIADSWLGSPAAPSASYPEWWREFDDPILTRLIELAVSQNLSLRQAGLRVIQARALRGIAAGQFFPQSQSIVADATQNHVSENTPQGLVDQSYGDYSIGAEAAWELDFWGRFRRGIEASDAGLEASVAEYDTALVLLAADVASDYVLIRSLEEQLTFTRASVLSQQDTLELTRVRFEAGAVSELDVATAQGTLSRTQALVPVLEDSLQQTRLALCVLLGRTPSTLEDELGEKKPVPTPPATIAAGIPADLLRRRPDVRRAERIAASLSAEIGVATADRYPSFTLSGLTGFHASTFETAGSSPGVEDLLDADSFEGFLGLGVNWPFLDYGRIANRIRFADARFQEAAVAYQDSVLRAAADVEGGLSKFLYARELVLFLSQSEEAAERAVELSLIQYRQGATDFLRVNQAQIDLVARQNELVLARAGVAVAAIQTYRALGGGWEVRAGLEFVPPETVEEMRARTDWGDLLQPDYDRGADVLFERPPDRPRESAGPDQETPDGPPR